MLVLNNTPFVHSRVYLQYFNSAFPGAAITLHIAIYKKTNKEIKTREIIERRKERKKEAHLALALR